MSIQWNSAKQDEPKVRSFAEEHKFTYDWHQKMLRKQRRQELGMKIVQFLGLVSLLVICIIVAAEHTK